MADNKVSRNYQLYVACKMDIASYVATQYGWVHLIVFDGLILLMYLFISIILAMADNKVSRIASIAKVANNKI